MTGHTITAVVHTKGKLQVFCSCGWHSRLRRYVSAHEVHELHVQRSAPFDLQRHFDALMGRA